MARTYAKPRDLRLIPPDAVAIGMAGTAEQLSVEGLVNPIPDGPRRAGKEKQGVVPLLGFPRLDFCFVLKALLACLGPPLASA